MSLLLQGDRHHFQKESICVEFPGDNITGVIKYPAADSSKMWSRWAIPVLDLV